MKKGIGCVVLFGAVGLAALTGCGPSSTPATGSSQPAASSPAASSSAGAGATTGSTTPAPAAAPVLKTGSTSLGTIVVDGRGMSVYHFDKDTANTGKSTCNAGCAALWPAVKATSSTPAAAGVTGKVGTITRDDGSLQVTVNGLPVYTYGKDTAAGDVQGQGVGGVWWAVTPAGDKVAGAPSGY
ncbi:COG4315 family predicted lipoprotein [Pseudarthrobacter sp. S9]|uniref:COG4315 family predicted lipoprotein n=1 Tax=Pseudarthrobacter sp. S9 TaxID=3418421 RepID=UPI003D080E70